MTVADRVAVLRLGQLVSIGPLSQYDATVDRRPDDHGYLQAPRRYPGRALIRELQ